MEVYTEYMLIDFNKVLLPNLVPDLKNSSAKKYWGTVFLGIFAMLSNLIQFLVF